MVRIRAPFTCHLFCLSSHHWKCFTLKRRFFIVERDSITCQIFSINTINIEKTFLLPVILQTASVKNQIRMADQNKTARKMYFLSLGWAEQNYYKTPINATDFQFWLICHPGVCKIRLAQNYLSKIPFKSSEVHQVHKNSTSLSIESFKSHFKTWLVEKYAFQVNSKTSRVDHSRNSNTRWSVDWSSSYKNLNL